MHTCISIYIKFILDGAYGGYRKTVRKTKQCKTNQTKNIGARRHPGGHDGEDHEGAGARRGDAEAAGDEGHHGKGVFQLFHLPLRSFFQRRKKAPLFLAAFSPPFSPSFSSLCLLSLVPLLLFVEEEKRGETKGSEAAQGGKTNTKNSPFPPSTSKRQTKKNLEQKIKKKNPKTSRRCSPIRWPL